MSWDLPRPFCQAFSIAAEAIDHYGHVNNAEYLRLVEEVSWKHSQQLGLGIEDYRRLDRAMVVIRHELDYLAPCYEGDRVEMATWIVACDQRNRLVRRFQLQDVSGNKTLFRARTEFACVSLSGHRPRRLPDAFLQAYLPALIAETATHL